MRCWRALPIPTSAPASAKNSPKTVLRNFGRLESWADIRIANSPTAQAGKTIDELERERGQDPLDVACDVIIADRGATRILVRSMSEEDVQRIVADPGTCCSTEMYRRLAAS